VSNSARRRNGENLTGIEIIMKGAPRALGKVVDAKGQPIAGAEIIAFSPETGYQMAFLTGIKPATVTSDREGNFQIFIKSSHAVFLLAQAQGYDFDAKFLEDVEPGMVKSGLTLTLSKGGSMQGQVIDQDGSPRAGVTMKIIFSGKVGGGDEWLTNYLMFQTSFKAAHRELRTDAKGCFTAHNLRPGQWSVFEKKGMNPLGENGETFTVVIGETAQVKIERVLPLFIEGVLVDETGAPVSSGYVVAVSADRKSHDSAQADERGCFKINGLKPGTYILAASSKGFASAAVKDVQAGSTGIRIVMSRDGGEKK